MLLIIRYTNVVLSTEGVIGIFAVLVLNFVMLNKILSNWFEQKITTLDSAKTVGELYKSGAITENKDK